MEYRLLECPFCGHDSLWVHLDEWDRGVVECDFCDAVGPLVDRVTCPDENDRLEKAVSLWNARPAPPKPIVITGSLTVGEKDGLHYVMDETGIHYYIGNNLIWERVGMWTK